MNILILDNEEIVISFCLYVLKDGSFAMAETKEKLKEIYASENIDFDKVENHNVVFKKPSFSDMAKIFSSVNTQDGLNLDFNPIEIRFKRMEYLIKKWSFKDESGKEIPATKENVGKLNPSLANFIGTLLEIETNF